MKNIFEEKAKVQYRPDKIVDTALARVGVFKVIPLADLFQLIIDQKLPKCFFELEHDRYMPLDSNNLQKNKLRSIKVEKKVKYSGSRRQRKSITTTLYSSEVFLSEHVLKRVYQRSGLRGLSASDFHFPKSAYLEELYAGWLKLDAECVTQTKDRRHDFIYPYKSGAFLGLIGVNPNLRKQKFLFTSDGVLKNIDEEPDVINVFIAKTFINYEMMNIKQKEVYNLWSVGQYKSAASRMLSIDSLQTKVQVTNILPINPLKIFPVEQLSDSDAA